MSKTKRKSVIEGSKSGLSGPTAAALSPTRRPSVFERLGPGSSSFSSNKSQPRKSGEIKQRSHDKPSAGGHSRESGGGSAVEPVSHHGTVKRTKKKRSRSREKKEQVADVRSKISFRPSESGGDHKSKESVAHSPPSPKRAVQSETRRREPEAKIRSQVAVVTNRLPHSNSKPNEKGSNQSTEDWRTDRSNLDFQEEFILEKKRQQLQRELELEMQKERLLKIQHDNVVTEKRVSSSTSSSSSSAASSSSSGSTSSSSSSSSSEGEDNSSSSMSSISCNRGKNKTAAKRSTKVVSSLSGSNSEADIVRAKKGNTDVKMKKDSHSVKTKSSRVEEREIRRDQPNLAVQERRKKGIVSPPDVHNKAKHSTAISSNLHINTGTSSVSSGKHKISHHPVAGQMKGTEKLRKPSNSAVLRKEVPNSEGSRNREHSPSPMIPPTQSRVGKPTSSKPTALVKKKHNVDGANLEVHNKIEKTKSISRSKPSLSMVSESQKAKHRVTSVEDTRGTRLKANSPKPEVRGRRTPPQIVRTTESRHSSIQSIPREKRPGRHPSSPPPLPPPPPPPPPPVHRSCDLDKTKIGRDRRQPNVMDPINKPSSESARKGTKDPKEGKRESAQNVKNVSRGREDQKDSRSVHPPDSHHGHAKSESDRGRDIGRHRLSDVDSHSNPVDRGRLIEPRGPHSPPRRDRNDGKKTERSSVGSHSLSSREGIIDRLRDLSRTSVDISGDYRGRRESTGRVIPEIPPEPRSLPEDRVGKGMVERDRRGRLLPEEPRYVTPDLPDHRRRPLSPPPSKYHSRNVTPPPRPASPAPPPPRHWSRDHPDPRDSDIPYSSDRRKGSSPLPHNYDMRNYNDVEMYDYGRSDHRGHDHLGHNQRRDAYHSFPPPEPLDIYERDAPQSRQDYGHGDQRRDDYIHSNRWENTRDDRLKGVSEQERLRDNERWHDEDLTAKRKRARDDPLEKLPLPKRRRGLTPPTVDNQRSSRGVTSNDSSRPTDGRGRKRLSCDSTSSSSRGNNQRTSTTSEAPRTTKDSTTTQSTDVKDGDRTKRRSEVSKDAIGDIRSTRAEENKRKRPRTPDRNDKPIKLRKLSPSKSAAKDDKPTEKSGCKDIKPEKIVVEKEITQVANEKEEIMPTPVVSGKPPSPTMPTTESFSDWTDDDSMDLLNQEENAESNVAESAEKTESVAPADVAPIPSLETNKDVPVVVKEEKNISPGSEKKKEETSALSKDDKGRRKPKSEGGEDSRGSFEDGSQRERKSRDRYRDDRGGIVNRSTKSTSRHASLERSSRRRHHDLETADKPRSKVATPISRPRTPVSRPRTPTSPPPQRPVAEPTISDNGKKPLSKPADIPVIPADDPVVAQIAAPKEKVAAALDDCEYDPISDEELEPMIEEPDDKEIESEKGSTDAVDVDWASLVRDNYQSQTNRESNKQSVLKKFTPSSILYRIGVSAKYAGPELMERINKVMMEEHSTNGGLDHGEGEPAKFAFEDEMASFHAMSVAQKKERETILDDIGPYRQALCARRDLQIRRKLCRLKLKESSFSIHNIDLDTFKLSLQLLQQRRNAAVVA